MIVKKGFTRLFNKQDIFVCSHNKVVIRHGAIYKYPKLVTNKTIKPPGVKETKLDNLLNSLDDKILYSSFLASQNMAVRWKIRRIQLRNEKNLSEQPTFPLAAKLLTNKFNNAEEGNESSIVDEEINAPFNLPYKSVTHVETVIINESGHSDNTNKSSKHNETVSDNPAYRPGYVHWMSDYECFDEVPRGYEEDVSEIASKYGTPDPGIPVSAVPCGGCGALLHCQNPSIPGYLPRELFVPCGDEDLRAIVCQRCHFLKKFNTALSVTVDPVQYPKLIEVIKSKRGLVILMVDVTDFPCSIWPNITELIGDCPLVVVGNKIDAIPYDCPGWLNQAAKSLKAEFPENANIQHVALISAKTGFGVEELITKLQSTWQTKGDIYLVGCTNVGKSTLFNMFLRSDFCKAKAADLMKRATTSPWPGTTLNLLKFPLMRPSGWRMFLRTNRLKQERIQLIRERQLAHIQKKLLKTKTRKIARPQLIGSLGRTFVEAPMQYTDMFMMHKKQVGTAVTSGGGLNETAKPFLDSHWCYDTPGVVHPDQIINELTMEELMKIEQNQTMLPRMYKFNPGQTLFIAGLGRLDFIHGDGYFRIITYTVQSLPITICKLEYADEVYDSLLGTEVLGLPCGNKERIAAFPKLKAAPRFEFIGRNPLAVCAELVLSNAGWVSFIAKADHKGVFQAWTPGGRGIYRRKEPLLTVMPKLRRQRLSITPQYLLHYERPESR